MVRGRFITFEGPEGSGKSTQAGRLAVELAGQGVEVVTTREPGGTPTGDLIRGILQHDTSGEPIHAEAEVLLFAASRAQLVHRVIQPALERGAWVICDRYIDSTTAYQGYARGYCVDLIQRINQFATGGLMPDITLLLDLSAADGALRMQARYAANGEQKDRFEREHFSFHERVREGYLTLAKDAPERFCVINAKRNEDEVFGEIWAHVRRLKEAAS